MTSSPDAMLTISLPRKLWDALATFAAIETENAYGDDTIHRGDIALAEAAVDAVNAALER